MNIKSFFIPDNCLQGDEFPAHIIWDKSKNVEVIIEYENPINLKKIYNIPSDGIKQINKNKIVINKYDINGYIGFVFCSNIGSKFNYSPNIKFKIKDIKSDENLVIQREIELFRPFIETVNIPKKIDISYNSKTKSYKIKNRLKLANIGNGTAIIAPVLSEDYYDKNEDLKKSIEMILPKNFGNFLSQVFEDLSVELEDLTNKYPQYSEIINEYLDTSNQFSELNLEIMDKIKKLNESFEKAFEENDDFYEDFGWAFASSYFKNIHLITEIRSFINYLDSIGKGRVILANYFEIIKIKEKNAKLRLQIRLTDLAFQKYKPIELPIIEINCEKECEIPVHLLFDWKIKEVK